MGVVKGGDIRSCKINNREFEVPTGTSKTLRTSGFNNEAKASGNGKMSIMQTRILGGFSDLVVMVDDDRQDLEFLQEIADSGNPVQVSVTYASGATYAGSLSLVGEIGKNTADGTATISMSGERFSQI